MKEFVEWLVLWEVGKPHGLEPTTLGHKVEVKYNTKAGLANGTAQNEETSEDGNVKVQIDRAHIKVLEWKHYLVVAMEPIILVGGLLCSFGYSIWYWSLLLIGAGI
jgi:nitrate reductase NapE component